MQLNKIGFGAILNFHTAPSGFSGSNVKINTDLQIIGIDLIPYIDFEKRLHTIEMIYRTQLARGFSLKYHPIPQFNVSEGMSFIKYDFMEPSGLPGGTYLSLYDQADTPFSVIESGVKLNFDIGDTVCLTTDQFNIVEYPHHPHQIGAPLIISALRCGRDTLTFEDERGFPVRETVPTWYAVLRTMDYSYLAHLSDNLDYSFWLPVGVFRSGKIDGYIEKTEVRKRNYIGRFDRFV